MKNKRILIILTTLIIILFIGIGIYLFGFLAEYFDYQNNEAVYGACLNNDEIADYEIIEEKTIGGDGIAIIIIKDKNSQKEKFKFQIDVLQTKHYHPIELHKCGAYAVKSFNYDYIVHKPLADYRSELWKYNYYGNGESLILLDEDTIGNLKGYKYFFNSDFRIDSLEKYIILEKGYLGKENYSLVVKDLNTKEDVFTLSAKSIQEQYPNIVGSFGFDKWTDDGRYFWGDIFEGAYINGFFRIDTQNWKADIFEAPQDVLGGDALNVENGYITVHPGNTWFGFADMTEEEKEKRRKQGIGTELYIENLFTKKREFIAKTNEPLYYFKSKWLSDTELQYELPTGENKIYTINKK